MLSEAHLRQHNEVTDNESEVNKCDVRFQEENGVGTSVTKEVCQDETQLQVLMSEANSKEKQFF